MFSSTTRSALIALALAAAPAFAAKDLSVKVTGPDSITDVDNFVVQTVITNKGDEAVTLLNSPESILTPGLKTNVFGITSADGKAAVFDGVRVKWSPETAIANQDFTVLAPGESKTITQDLSGVYNLTDSQAGAYTIDAKKQFLLYDSGKVSSISASSTQAHTAHFDGQLASKKAAQRKANSVASRRKRQTYTGCTSSQQSSIATAVTSAQTYAANAYSYLTGISAATTRYTTWFGAYTASRKSTVQSHYQLISGDPAAGLYDCGCSEAGVYAYVYPDDPYHIYLCPVFWSAPTTGTDSKAGTIVHELSHFTVNGGTQDYAYGQSAAKSLASSSPSQAVFNADNHEYFAENNPVLS